MSNFQLSCRLCKSARVLLKVNEKSFRHQQLSQENAGKEILAAFKQSDTKKQGFITAQELRQILTSTGEKVGYIHGNTYKNLLVDTTRV